MIGRIFALLLLLIILFVSFSWLSSGGWNQIKAAAVKYGNPLGEFWEDQKGKPVNYSIESLSPATPSISSGVPSGTNSNSAAEAEAVRQFGDPSPQRGLVEIVPSSVYYVGGKNLSNEFINIKAADTNTGPISITGWSLASAVSGVRKYIPAGTTVYRLGGIPQNQTIALAAGERAVINSGNSPVGVSFKVNKCSGYLGQFQSFNPSLSASCPTPASEMPNTLSNLQNYGAECVDYVKSIPRCTYHLSAFPEALNNACKSFISNVLTYNGCLDRHQFDGDFSSNLWRVYLGNSSPLWHPSHDVIRLLDASGRTVDVYSY